MVYLAAVLLKQFIKQHWQEDEETFIHPVVSTTEKVNNNEKNRPRKEQGREDLLLKWMIMTMMFHSRTRKREEKKYGKAREKRGNEEAIRQYLLQALDDPHGKICTAVGMAVASIANYDWPEDWPNLLPVLLKLISNQADMNGVRNKRAEDPDDWSMRIEGTDDSYPGRVDSDGSEQSLESFAVQMIGGNYKELVYYTIPFLQMTVEQVHAWSSDVNQYIADEDNGTCSCRASGILLLEEVVTIYGADGVEAIIDAVEKHFNESCKARAGGSRGWWKIGHNVLEQFLRLAVEAIAVNVAPPVKVGACRAISQLLTESDQRILQPQMMSLLPSLIDLLKQASDDSLHLVLEALQAAIKAGDLQDAPIDIVKAVYNVCFNSVVSIILQSDDNSEMQNATECLAALVLGGKQELLAWSGNPEFTMKSLLSAASRLSTVYQTGLFFFLNCGSAFYGIRVLSDERRGHLKEYPGDSLLEYPLPSGKSADSCDILVTVSSIDLSEKNVALLILHLPAQMTHHIRDLVAAIVRRMQSCLIEGLKSSLLLILARLAALGWAGLRLCLNPSNPLSFTPAAGSNCKTSVCGAGANTTAGITTRSKGKLAPDQWTMIPLPGKILALLADTLIEIQEQHWDDDGDDNEVVTAHYSLTFATWLGVLDNVMSDGDWEIVQDSESITQEDMLNSINSASFKPTIEHLDVLTKIMNASEDDDGEDNILKGDDSLNEINLARYMVNFFRQFADSDRQLFDNLCQNLTRAEKKAIQRVLKRLMLDTSALSTLPNFKFHVGGPGGRTWFQVHVEYLSDIPVGAGIFLPVVASGVFLVCK
ncbi:hypothetical protein ACLOJK_031131 [Asimina triloba]